jgi:hypothetical protein
MHVDAAGATIDLGGPQLNGGQTGAWISPMVDEEMTIRNPAL